MRALALAALLLLIACGEVQRPNVVLVTIDTLRADHTSLEGYARDTTPTLRRVAAEGVHVPGAYSVSATTAPSHASLFSGLYPQRHGVAKNGVALPGSIPVLAAQLRAAGYQTAGFASSFVLHSKFGFGRGFEAYADDFPAADSTMDVEEWEGSHVSGGFDRRAAATNELVFAWLREQRDPERPFFLFVHYFDPHAPYDPPAPFFADFVAGGDGTQLDTAVRTYDGEIAYTDQQLGRLLELLDALELRDDTLLVVAGDHGEAFLDHGILRHGPQLYDEAVRIPLVFRWPGTLPAGQRVEGLVSLVDVAPSVLELVGLQADSAAGQGASLAAALRDAGSLPRQRSVFLQRRHYEDGSVQGLVVRGPKNAIRRGRFKFIEAPEEGSRELYDLVADPGETRNLLYEDPQRAAALRESLDAWLEPAAGPDASANPDLEISDEDRRALRALGYAD